MMLLLIAAAANPAWQPPLPSQMRLIMQPDIAETLVEDFERGLLVPPPACFPTDGARGGP